MSKVRRQILRAAAYAVAGGAVFQIGGCSLSDVLSFAKDFNPCGTILNCDPVQYRFLTSGYQAPGADPDIDPACTYPPFCANDPFVSTITTTQ